MKAAILRAPGVPEFGEIPDPVSYLPVVEVSLAGVNPIDLFLATQPGDFPRVPGTEGVGTHDGRRVYFSSVAPHGSMAERAVAQPERMIGVPDDVSDAVAVTLGVAGLTASLSLTDCARMQAGETVLILGASGMVGRLAVQIAREKGAARVVAAGRNIAALEDLGADAVVSLADATDATVLAQTIREATGGGADVIIDPVWGVPAVAALMAGKPGGRLVQLGHSASFSTVLAPAFMRRTGVAILGYSSSLATPARRAKVYAELCQLSAAGKLSAPAEVLPLGKIAEAWSRQAASPNVKLCIDTRA